MEGGSDLNKYLAMGGAGFGAKFDGLSTWVKENKAKAAVVIIIISFIVLVLIAAMTTGGVMQDNVVFYLNPMNLMDYIKDTVCY